MSKLTVRTLVMALVTLAPVPALAQHHNAQQGVGIDVKAAPIFASLSQGNSNWQARKGVVGGVSFGVHRQGTFAVMAEALYARRGASNLGANAYLNMIEVPVLMRINAGHARPTGVHVYGLVGQALDINLRTAQNKAARINVLDPNVVVGGGVEVSRITIEGRENIGLRTLAPNTPNLKSRSFSVMVGYRIR